MPSVESLRRASKHDSSSSRSTSIFIVIPHLQYLEHKCESQLEYRVTIGCGLWLRCGIFGYKTKPKMEMEIEIEIKIESGE